MDWINGKQALRRQLNASLAAALQQSHSFAHTDRIWARLRTAGDLTVTQVAAIATAVRDNSQVYGAQCRVTEDYGEWYPQLILTSLLTQPGYEENRELIAEVARLRKVDGLL